MRIMSGKTARYVSQLSRRCVLRCCFTSRCCAGVFVFVQSWDLVEPYEVLCGPDCFHHVLDPSVGTFPENSIGDESSLDPYKEEESPVLVFMTGHLPVLKDGIDNEETGEK